MSGPAQRSFGVNAALAHHVVREVAQAAEANGYHAFWANDMPRGEGLAALQAAAAVTRTIRLGVGLIPLDRHSPERIATRIAELRLPVERLTLGVGSGRAPGGLARVRSGVLTLRGLTRAAVVIGALGPRMCRLGGEVADGVLLDWVTPAHVRTAAQIAADAAAAAGRPRPRTLGYVFTALGAAAAGSLQVEADHYGSVPSYAANFRRMGVAPSEAAVVGETAGQIRLGLAAYDAEWDETVVRATVAEDRAAAYLEVVTAAAPI